MKPDRKGIRGAQIRLNDPTITPIEPVGLRVIVPIDCNKREFAHLKTRGRSFVSMHSRGDMPGYEK